MRFGNIDFPQALLDAMREGRLVVFAGAGVSMGPPAWLPSFPQLASQIAQGRVVRKLDSAFLDRELGELEREGVLVHQLCREILQSGPPHCNELHKSLLRLFAESGSVRVVTTNYDPHFTSAALEVWGVSPEVFAAPALPLGSDFSGIVHVHGSLQAKSAIVLTDTDFGKAYLTQGWARRFLLDVFSNYTVLFVGYRHEETVMRYMARALPPGLTKDRFALIRDDEGTQSWHSLGIVPVQFPKSDGDGFANLRNGVAALAAAERRGALELKSDIGRIAAAPPPHDVITEDQIRHAVSQAATLRYFTRTARPALWLDWMDERGMLDALFTSAPLTEAGNELCVWAAKDVLEESSTLMGVAGKHGLEFNPGFWQQLTYTLTINGDKSPPPFFRRWLILLLARPPVPPDGHALLRLASVASHLHDADGVLEIFKLMCRSSVSVVHDDWFEVPSARARSSVALRQKIGTSQHLILRLWRETIQPRLAQVHGTALSICIDLLEQRFTLRRRWDSHREISWDSDSASRAAIEPHRQDRLTKELAPLIDGARACLEWMSTNSSAATLTDTRDRLWKCKAPLLQRLAIHVTTISRETSDIKLAWLIGLGGFDRSLQYEVFALLRRCYPEASAETRSSTMHWVGSLEAPSVIPEDEKLQVRDWLQWEVLRRLNECAPECAFVQAAMEPLRSRHTDWSTASEEDVLIKHVQIEPGQRLSPVSVDELLKKPASDWVEMFITYEEERILGPTREGLWHAAREAAKQDAQWERSLLTELQAHWDSPLWSTLIAGWHRWPEGEAEAIERLEWLQQPQMLRHHAHAASHVLRSLVNGPPKPYVASLIPRADSLCDGLRAALEMEPITYERNGWLDAAINLPSGSLALYVLDSLQFRSGINSEPPSGLGADVETLLASLLAMGNGHDAYARAVLASRLVQLTEVAPEWTEKTVAPWLSSPDDDCFEQGWDGFILGGRYDVAFGEMLKPAFLAASPRIARLLRGRLADYVDIYVTYLLLDEDPLKEWAPRLIQDSDEETRQLFAWRMHWLMSQEPSTRVKTWWDGWLRTYWERRLTGIPARLAGVEVAEMLAWPSVLPQVFEEAVSLAAAMEPGHLEHTPLMDDLVQRGLPQSHPEATAIYLTAMLSWSGIRNVSWEVPDVIRLLDRTKISAATIGALDSALATSGLNDLEWAPEDTKD